MYGTNGTALHPSNTFNESDLLIEANEKKNGARGPSKVRQTADHNQESARRQFVLMTRTLFFQQFRKEKTILFPKKKYLKNIQKNYV